MWKRIAYEDWMPVITALAFFITFTAFLIFTIRAIRLRREERDRLAALPLEPETSAQPSSHERPDQGSR